MKKLLTNTQPLIKYVVLTNTLSFTTFSSSNCLAISCNDNLSSLCIIPDKEKDKELKKKW